MTVALRARHRGWARSRAERHSAGDARRGRCRSNRGPPGFHVNAVIRRHAIGTSSSPPTRKHPSANGWPSSCVPSQAGASRSRLRAPRSAAKCAERMRVAPAPRLARRRLAPPRHGVAQGRQSTTARSARPRAKGVVRLAGAERSHPAVAITRMTEAGRSLLASWLVGSGRCHLESNSAGVPPASSCMTTAQPGRTSSPPRQAGRLLAWRSARAVAALVTKAPMSSARRCGVEVCSCEMGADR